MFNFLELDEDAQNQVILEGARLNLEDVDRMESHLESNPNDLATRVKILSYYKLYMYEPEHNQAKHLLHVLWLIDNYPDHGFNLRSLLVNIGFLGSPLLDQVREHWFRQLESQPENPAVLGNAGSFLIWSEFERGQELIEQAQRLDPENHWWAQLLGQFNFIQMKEAEDKEEMSRYGQKVLDQARRLNALGGGPVPAMVAEWVTECSAVLDNAECLELAQELKKKTKPPSPLLINARRGLAALEEDNVDSAVELLLKKEDGHKSILHPVIRSLAQELCRRNRGDAVIRWVEAIEGIPWVESVKTEWITEIEKGGAPSFDWR